MTPVNFRQLSNFIWSVADLLRGPYRPPQYERVMLPMTVKPDTRVAIVFNGSPLFTGGAGSGESEIRRWIIEHDWLEAIIALPEQMFYNTGIGTYIWGVSNRKSDERWGRIQLLDARDRSKSEFQKLWQELSISVELLKERRSALIVWDTATSRRFRHFERRAS